MAGPGPKRRRGSISPPPEIMGDDEPKSISEHKPSEDVEAKISSAFNALGFTDIEQKSFLFKDELAAAQKTIEETEAYLKDKALDVKPILIPTSASDPKDLQNRISEINAAAVESAKAAIETVKDFKESAITYRDFIQKFSYQLYESLLAEAKKIPAIRAEEKAIEASRAKALKAFKQECIKKLTEYVLPVAEALKNKILEEQDPAEAKSLIEKFNKDFKGIADLKIKINIKNIKAADIINIKYTNINTMLKEWKSIANKADKVFIKYEFDESSALDQLVKVINALAKNFSTDFRNPTINFKGFIESSPEYFKPLTESKTTSLYEVVNPPPSKTVASQIDDAKKRLLANHEKMLKNLNSSKFRNLKIETVNALEFFKTNKLITSELFSTLEAKVNSAPESKFNDKSLLSTSDLESLSVQVAAEFEALSKRHNEGVSLEAYSAKKSLEGLQKKATSVLASLRDKNLLLDELVPLKTDTNKIFETIKASGIAQHSSYIRDTEASAKAAEEEAKSQRVAEGRRRKEQEAEREAKQAEEKNKIAKREAELAAEQKRQQEKEHRAQQALAALEAEDKAQQAELQKKQAAEEAKKAAELKALPKEEKLDQAFIDTKKLFEEILGFDLIKDKLAKNKYDSPGKKDRDQSQIANWNERFNAWYNNYWNHLSPHLPDLFKISQPLEYKFDGNFNAILRNFGAEDTTKINSRISDINKLSIEKLKSLHERVKAYHGLKKSPEEQQGLQFELQAQFQKFSEMIFSKKPLTQKDAEEALGVMKSSIIYTTRVLDLISAPVATSASGGSGILFPNPPEEKKKPAPASEPVKPKTAPAKGSRNTGKQ